MTGSGHDPAVPLDIADDRLAEAALLVHVARVDGRVGDEERRALLGLIRSGYGLDQAQAERLAERAGRLDHEVDDVAALVELLGHERDGDDGRRLLAMAHRLAAADGTVGEFEADLLWRMGGLLGLDEREIEAVRTAAGRTDGRS